MNTQHISDAMDLELQRLGWLSSKWDEAALELMKYVRGEEDVFGVRMDEFWGRSPSGRAGQATPEARSGLRHSVTIPNASGANGE